SGAIADNDYIQFTVTPNAGFTFSATSFNFIWDRSSTGPGELTLRSSLDGYTTDLGSLTGLPASITAIRSIPLSLSNISTPVTFRLYAYGATGAGGTGGFDTTTSNPTPNVTLF